MAHDHSLFGLPAVRWFSLRGSREAGDRHSKRPALDCEREKPEGWGGPMLKLLKLLAIVSAPLFATTAASD